MSKRGIKSNSFQIAILAFCLCMPCFYAFQAQAQVVINRPVPGGVTSEFGLRTLGGVTRGHRGTDYSAAEGTLVSITPGYLGTPSYRPNNGAAGRTVDLNYDCGVRVRHFHLSSYNAGPPPEIRSGSSGASGDGSYAPHLHFEIHIDGQPVDPEAAYGLDLCDDTIAECLKEDGRQRLAGAIPRGEDQDVCGGGGAPYNGPPPLTPPPDTGTVPPHDDSSSSRPPITPPTHSPPVGGGGPEDGVGPPAGGPVLWDDSEYITGSLTTNACDVEVFVVMRGRAAMEAQEDVVTSEITIHRPDSVMEYTCLDQFMGYTAERADRLFSGTTDWLLRIFPLTVGTPTFVIVHLDPTSLDQVLEDTVVAAIDDYVDEQFPLDFLGDTASGLDSNISSSIGGASYSCDRMNRVWEVAKCENFADTNFFTGPTPFYTFNEMIPNTNDPRTQYNSCNDTGLFPVDIEVMTNAGFAYHGFNPPVLISGDNIHDYVDPAVCTGLEPIPTGVQVVKIERFGEPTENIIEYEEHFCPNPGCYFDHTTSTCSK